VHNLRIAVPTCSEPVPLFGLATGLDEATESDDENSDDETAVATAAQDTAAVNDDCCEVCLVAERNVCIALLPCATSVSVSRELTKCSVRDVVVPSAVLELT